MNLALPQQILHLMPIKEVLLYVIERRGALMCVRVGTRLCWGGATWPSSQHSFLFFALEHSRKGRLVAQTFNLDQRFTSISS